MAKSVVEIRVFVACPSDCDKYRAVVKTAIQEVNASAGRVHSARLEYVGWDTDVVPAVALRGQEVINQQIGDGYDVFLGVLANRFGTPTGVYGSGTEEEFLRAMRRFEKTGTPRIMIYTDASPINPASLDLEQLSKVRTFIKNIQGAGTLTATFVDGDNFEASLRVHLSRVLVELVAGHSGPKSLDASVSAMPSAPTADPSGEADLGLFDALELVQSNLESATTAMVQMGDFGNALVKAMREKQEKNAAITERANPAIARQVVDSVADDLDLYAIRTRDQLAKVSGFFRSGMDTLSKALTIAQEDMRDQMGDLAGLKSNMNAMVTGIEEAIAGTSELRALLSSLPRLTSRLNQARRQAVTCLDRVESEFRLYITWVQSAVALIP